MSQSCIGRVSVLHRVHVVDIQGAAVLEHGQNDRQADRGLSRRHHHHEEREEVAGHLLPLVGEGDEAEVDARSASARCDMNTVMMLRRKMKPATPSENSTALSIRNQESGTCARHSISLRASTMAPTMAIRIRIEVTSNGNK